LHAKPSKRVWRLAAALLVIHAALLGLSIVSNAVTIDEVCHLPVGISYWHYGRFWCYHHNPPLIRLLFALPAVLLDVPTDYRNYQYVPLSRMADGQLGWDFMLANRNHYMLVYALCRAVVAGLSVWGGYLIFRWSWQLFGDAGSLISLALWTFHPEALAHGGLVTTDLGAAVLGFFGTWRFWCYLKSPSAAGAFVCGILLGLAEAAKFSCVVLPLVWAALAVIKLIRERRSPDAVGRLGWKRAPSHATLLCFVAVVVLNDVYFFEGTGRALGSFEFRSRLLTGHPSSQGHEPAHLAPGNRFRGTVLESVPVPFPDHYLLGFDDQMYDADSGLFYKYLRGERRRGNGWWYYYFYALLVKSPLAMLLLAGLALAAMLWRRSCRVDWLSEAAILLPIIVYWVIFSANVGLNFFRYVLPVFPFLFVFAGRLGVMFSSGGWASKALLSAAVAWNAVSVLAVHPHYLTYFNEAAGGPRNGVRHLADSNIDWGQGLIALRDWLHEHAPGEKIMLAYFGNMYPEVLDIRYELPPFGPSAFGETKVEALDPSQIGPVPGLQAVSANFLLGQPWSAPNAYGGVTQIPENALTYYQRFQPVAIPGNSIYVYDLSVPQVNRVRREMGLPPWRPPGKEAVSAVR